jgi:chromosome partitioning protein
MKPEDLVGIAEIADLAGVSKQVVTNWRHRHDDFPKPIQTLQSGPVWNKEVIMTWLKNRSDEPTHVLSFINLKGGVAKTTTAVAVAEMLAQQHRKRVLVIDLDPQTNATVTLIKEEKWAELDAAGSTIAQLFADKMNPEAAPRFDVERAIVHQVSTISDGIAKLDLLPSSIKLIGLQDRISMIALQNNYASKPIDILKEALDPIIGRYNYVIIDCPPSLGDVTKNGLRISTGYVIPTIPDILSTWGIYQIVQSVHELGQSLARPVPALGIVATKVQKNNLHSRIIADLRASRLGQFGDGSTLPQPPLFEATVRQTVDVSRGADVNTDLRTFKGKYGSAYDDFVALTQEILDKCEKKKS